VKFVVDKVALGQVFSEYFDFPCQFSFPRLLNIHHLSPGAGTMGQLVADEPTGLTLTPLQKTKKKNHHNIYMLKSGLHASLAGGKGHIFLSFVFTYRTRPLKVS
jgi:hypothetical protein